MIDVRKTEVFVLWLDGLRDIQARARIQARIERLATGKPGRCRASRCRCLGVANQLWTGLPGVFQKRGRELIILLAGGDKSTQAKDIKAALRFARDLSE